jgi:heat shock protein HslJ
MSCNNNEPNSQDNELTDITWILFKYFDETSGINTIIPEENEYYSINFNNSGEINAHDACNDCTGSFEILNSNLVDITGMSCTEIACLGSQFLFSLNGEYIFQFDNDTLVLTLSEIQRGFYFVQE